MPEKKYYLMANGIQKGPFTIDELQREGVTEDTPVWFPGLPDWKRVSEVPELAFLIGGGSAFGGYAVPEVAPQPSYGQGGGYGDNYANPEYYAMIAGIKVGPAPVTTLISRGLNADTPVWRQGMGEWLPAHTQPEIMAMLNNSAQGNAYQQPQQPYQQQPYQQQPYQQPYQPAAPGMGIPHTNWMPWAIVATVLGLCSWIGLALGIVGIVKAKAANNAYAMGDQFEGDKNNNTAKICTLISLGIDTLGFILSLIVVLNGGY